MLHFLTDLITLSAMCSMMKFDLGVKPGQTDTTVSIAHMMSDNIRVHATNILIRLQLKQHGKKHN